MFNTQRLLYKLKLVNKQKWRHLQFQSQKN